MVQTIKRFGWRKDSPDHRDCVFRVATPVSLPPSCDLRGKFMPPVYDQKDLGSCTANAIAAAVDFERAKQGLPFITPSRLFIYFNERVIEGTVSQDIGAQIRDGIKSVASQGVCPESEWPYDESQFAVKPPDKCFADAVKFEALQYSSVAQAEYDLKHCLAIDCRPVVLGISVFPEIESDEVAASGVLPDPAPTDAPIGGHAILCVGYNDATKRFLCRNSWGADWGQGGYFTIPYDYLLNQGLASDFWVISAEAA